MVFIARLVKHTQLWKAWRGRHATGGEVGGVPFRLVTVDQYESGELTADQVNRLRGVVGVCLSSFADPSPTQEPVRIVEQQSVAAQQMRPPERPVQQRRR